MSLSKDKLIQLLTIVVLLLGISSSLYVHATQQEEVETITIGDEVFTVEQLLQICEHKELDEMGYRGIAMDDIILKAGVSSLENHEYTIIGEDGYQKTVE